MGLGLGRDVQLLVLALLSFVVTAWVDHKDVYERWTSESDYAKPGATEGRDHGLSPQDAVFQRRRPPVGIGRWRCRNASAGERA